MLIGKELLLKIDELDQLGHDEQFILLACGYENLESFDKAYADAIKSSEDLEQIQQQEELKVANNNIEKEKKRRDCEQKAKRDLKWLTEEREKIHTRRLNPITGDNLAIVLLRLREIYSVSKIAIACGYFDINLSKEELDLLILKDLPKDSLYHSSKAFGKLRLTPQIEIFQKEKKSSLEQYKSQVNLGSEEDIFIFKNRLCQNDCTWSCAYLYIPKRIVEESKDWDYSKVELIEFNFDNLLQEKLPKEDEIPRFLEDAKVTIEEYHEWKRDQEKQVLEKIEDKSFEEPMMSIFVEGKEYLDEYLDPSESLDDEELAEFYGIRLKDCVKDEDGSYLHDYWCD